MGRGFSILDNPNHQGESNTWLTPLSLIKNIKEFDLDPCGYKNHHTAKKIICLPNNGLDIEWYGDVWLNPPYGKYTKHWLNKLSVHGKGIALVFSRTDTEWFQNAAIKADWVFFIKGRIKFLRPDFTEATNAGHGSCLIGYGIDHKYTNKLNGVLWVK